MEPTHIRIVRTITAVEFTGEGDPLPDGTMMVAEAGFYFRPRPRGSNEHSMPFEVWNETRQEWAGATPGDMVRLDLGDDIYPIGRDEFDSMFEPLEPFEPDEA